MVGRCICSSPATIELVGITCTARLAERLVRTASAIVTPSDESAPGASKAATSTLSLALSLPDAISDPAGPMPSARSSMYPPVSSTSALTARMPPRTVRFHETCGLALMASVAMVPRPRASEGVPFGVYVGVAVAARRVTYCAYAVNSTIGSPSAMTTSAAGNTQSGRPIAMMAARARIATPRNAAT